MIVVRYGNGICTCREGKIENDARRNNDKLLDTYEVLKAELKDVYKHAGYMASAEGVKTYLEKRLFALERDINLLKKSYSKEMEDWIRKQPMRKANGLSISDTITGSKDGKES